MKQRESLKFMGVGKVLTAVIKGKFDIVHNHIGWRVLPFTDIIPHPIVTTLHGPLDIEYQRMVYKPYSHSPFVSISNNQRKPLKLNYAATVYNGIRVDKFPYLEKKDDYLAFLVMSPGGPVQAIQVAKKPSAANNGRQGCRGRKFFTEKVKPPLMAAKKPGAVGHAANQSCSPPLACWHSSSGRAVWPVHGRGHACTPEIAIFGGRTRSYCAKNCYLVHTTDEAARMGANPAQSSLSLSSTGASTLRWKPWWRAMLRCRKTNHEYRTRRNLKFVILFYLFFVIVTPTRRSCSPTSATSWQNAAHPDAGIKEICDTNGASSARAA
jgi:hypothetical protein